MTVQAVLSNKILREFLHAEAIAKTIEDATKEGYTLSENSIRFMINAQCTPAQKRVASRYLEYMVLGASACVEASAELGGACNA
jgi:hypothetical protein